MKCWRRLAGLAVALAMGSSAVAAQSSAELTALGDAAYKERRQKDALEHFLRAIAGDANNYEALWKASRSEIDLAEITSDRTALDSLLDAGQRHAESAIRANPADAEGHFSLARALGRRALSLGVRDRIRFSRLIRDAALAALKIDSAHPGALHVLGMWNAEIMRVNGLSRMIARSFLGAEIFNLASWDEAQRLMEASVQHDPTGSSIGSTWPGSMRIEATGNARANCTYGSRRPRWWSPTTTYTRGRPPSG